MRRWRAIDAAAIVALALAFGVLYRGWQVVWNWVAFANTLVPGLQDLFYGFWLSAAVVAAVLVRRPGAAVAAQTLAILTEISIGQQWSATALAAGLVQGSLAEFVFAFSAYRGYDGRTVMIAGTVAAIGSAVFDTIFRYPDTTMSTSGVTLAARAISGALLAGWLGGQAGDLMTSFYAAHRR